MGFPGPGQELGKASKARARAGARGGASSPMEFSGPLTTGFRDFFFKIRIGYCQEAAPTPWKPLSSFRA